MNKEKELSDFSKKIVKGFDMSYIKMLKYKIYKNSPVVISRNGRIIEEDPRKLLKEVQTKK
jgi:peroxiredoxin